MTGNNEFMSDSEVTTVAYYVYILCNEYATTLYVGVTNDLKRRVYEHRMKLLEGFSSRYNCTKLVWYEETENITSAIKREKQIKKWRRTFKDNLINAMNPEWRDLFKDIE